MTLNGLLLGILLLFGIFIGPALWCLKLGIGLKLSSGKELNPSGSVFGRCRWFLPSRKLQEKEINERINVPQGWNHVAWDRKACRQTSISEGELFFFEIVVEASCRN